MNKKEINTYIAFLMNAEFRKNLKYTEWKQLAEHDARISRQFDLAITQSLNNYYNKNADSL